MHTRLLAYDMKVSANNPSRGGTNPTVVAKSLSRGADLSIVANIATLVASTSRKRRHFEGMCLVARLVKGLIKHVAMCGCGAVPSGSSHGRSYPRWYPNLDARLLETSVSNPEG